MFRQPILLGGRGGANLLSGYVKIVTEISYNAEIVISTLSFKYVPEI